MVARAVRAVPDATVYTTAKNLVAVALLGPPRRLYRGCAGRPRQGYEW